MIHSKLNTVVDALEHLRSLTCNDVASWNHGSLWPATERRRESNDIKTSITFCAPCRNSIPTFIYSLHIKNEGLVSERFEVQDDASIMGPKLLVSRRYNEMIGCFETVQDKDIQLRSEYKYNKNILVASSASYTSMELMSSANWFERLVVCNDYENFILHWYEYGSYLGWIAYHMRNMGFPIDEIKFMNEAIDDGEENPMTFNCKTKEVMVNVRSSNANGESSWCMIEDLGNYPTMIFWKMITIREALLKNHVIVIKNLDRYLTTTIMQYIIDLFRNRQTNPMGSQLIFTASCDPEELVLV